MTFFLPDYGKITVKKLTIKSLNFRKDATKYKDKIKTAKKILPKKKGGEKGK